MDLSEFDSLIENAYKAHVTLPEAERLASKFLYFMNIIANELKNVGLDAAMRKNGLDDIHNALRIDLRSKYKGGNGGTSEPTIEAMIETDQTYRDHRTSLNITKNEKDFLESKFKTAETSHIFFRGIAKGKYD